MKSKFVLPVVVVAGIAAAVFAAALVHVRVSMTKGFRFRVGRPEEHT